MVAIQQVEVSAKRWLKDNQSLFDFEANADELEAWAFTSQSSAVLWREGEQITDHQSAGSKPVLRWCASAQGLDVGPARICSKSSPWLVVRELPGKQSKLTEGDVIQIGRETLHVRQLSKEDASLRSDLFGETCLPCQEQGVEAQCRICLMDGATDEDPFVQPCACSGSVANVHLGCLRQWAQTRMNLPSGLVDRCRIRKPFCEMCKELYPARIQRGREPQALVAMPLVAGPFMVLESTGKGSKAKGPGPKSAYHIVSFAKQTRASIGRGRDCAVRVDEASVSRWHSTLVFEEGEFCVKDNESKYGTLLAMRRTWRLAPGEWLPVKIGRTVLSLLPGESCADVAMSTHSEWTAEGGKSDLDA